MIALAEIFATITPLPGWATMWALALVIFFACKFATWVGDRTVIQTGGFRRRLPGQAHAVRVAAYFIAWPGMDPRAFFLRNVRREIPWHRAFATIARIILGISLIWIVVPRIPSDHPLLAGWIGMTGLILILHFGVLDLLGTFWQGRGVDAIPLMNAPTRTANLAEFWGKRWNTAFNRLAHRYVFAPLHRPLGVGGATLATFFVSGVIHDVVISVPAGAGYGLPTLYFLIQGLGVLAERSGPGRRAGLGRGLPGRLFAWGVVLAPLPWLFHEPFVTRVILPFLEVIR